MGSVTLDLAGGVLGMIGANEQGEATKRADYYNAAMARQNAAVAGMNAAIVGQAGAEQAGMQGLRNRATQGAIKTNQAAGNTSVNTGSNVGIRQSEAELGQLDAMTIRSNAVKEAYGYVTQQKNLEAESNLDVFEGQNAAAAGELQGYESLLGGVSKAETDFMNFYASGGLGSGETGSGGTG